MAALMSKASDIHTFAIDASAERQSSRSAVESVRRPLLVVDGALHAIVDHRFRIVALPADVRQ
jgi:hypothetical protein